MQKSLIEPYMTDTNYADRVSEVQSMIGITAHWMAIPLFLLFWLADLVYVPNLKWEFLGIRLLVIPICFIVNYLAKKTNNLNQLLNLCIFYSISLASGINAMIFLIQQPGTPYYAGLNLVALGCLSFLPFTNLKFIFSTFGIFGPYLAISIYYSKKMEDYWSLLINGFFIFASICICFLIRHFQENLRKKEMKAKYLLELELSHREEVIQLKTQEALNFQSLSNQFSPQIVEAIQSGKITIEGHPSKANLCAIFIDIVGSTEKVTHISAEQVAKVISEFLDICIKILLKYDLTIDKFLGDGIMAFCNAPLTRSNYVERVIHAAIEIQNYFKENQSQFMQYWNSPLQLRIGISEGNALVGFYGHDRYFKTYTALGPVINKASRLCGAADSNEILLDENVIKHNTGLFLVKSIGQRTLKGFQTEEVFALVGLISNQKNITRGLNECPECHQILSLEVNNLGHFVFVCRSCCTIVDMLAVPNVA